MDTLETRVTQKGQVTIPAEIRARLGLKPRDRVRFEVEGEAVTLRPARSRLARHYGAVRPAAPLDAREERRVFEEGVGQDNALEAARDAG